MKTTDTSKLALITIDMQTDTLAGRKLEIPGTSEILPNLVRTLQHARKKDIFIIHIVRIYLEDGSNAEPIRKKMILSGNKILSPGDDGTQIFRETLPDPSIRLDSENLLRGEPQYISEKEIILFKPRWGAFYNTRLNDILQAKNISSLCFIGVNFPNCPRTTIYEASERDYHIYAVKDAISGIYPQGEKELSNIGVVLMTTEEFIGSILV